MATSKKKAKKAAGAKGTARARSVASKDKKTSALKSASKKASAKFITAKAKAKAKSKSKVEPKTKTARAKKAVEKVAKKVAKKVVGGVVEGVASLSRTLAPKKTKAPAPEYSELVTPLDDRVLVLVEGESDRTIGGLYIPGTVTERPTRGRVVAVGRGARNKKGQLRPLDVVVGDAVLFAESSGTKLTLAGTELLLMRESDLLGVVG